MGTIKSANTLKQLNKVLPESRQEILEKLSERQWFAKTDFELQKELLTLPEDFTGYLIDLAKRQDEFGGLNLLKLLKLKKGNFIVLSIFKVRSQQTNQTMTYEYVSSKFGSNPGFRGILFLEVDGEVKYFVIKKSKKFAMGGEQVYDSIGGFIQFKNNNLVNLSKKVEDEIKRQLGLPELRIKRFIDLGQMTTDVGMTNTHVALFGAVVDANGATNLQAFKDSTIKHTKKISFEVLIEPIERINEYIHKADDSYFLACVARLTSTGFLKLQ